MEDIIRELRLGTLVIADGGLGTINASVLTVEYLKMKRIPVMGIIMNRFHENNRMEEDNRFMIETITGIPVIATVGINDGELKINIDLLISCYL